MFRLASSLLVVCVVLAGCSGATPSSSSSNPTVTSGADFTQAPSADTGSIKGTVTDEEMQPLAGVEVALLDVPGEAPSARTDATGNFGFAEVAPGSYRLAVQQLGYESVARKVEVVAGETQELKIVLTALTVVSATYKTDMIAGFVGCSLTIYTAQSAQQAVTVVCSEAALGQSVYPNNKNQHSWHVPKGYMTHMAELDWRANSDMAKQMRLLLSTIIDCTPAVCLVAAAYNDEKNGERPVKVGFDADERSALGKEFDLKARVRSGHPTGSTPAPVLVLDQKYTLYVTNFFGEVAPENFTATPPEPL